MRPDVLFFFTMTGTEEYAETSLVQESFWQSSQLCECCLCLLWQSVLRPSSEGKLLSLLRRSWSVNREKICVADCKMPFFFLLIVQNKQHPGECHNHEGNQNEMILA
jgi:hypothetical protein